MSAKTKTIEDLRAEIKTARDRVVALRHAREGAGHEERVARGELERFGTSLNDGTGGTELRDEDARLRQLVEEKAQALAQVLEKLDEAEEEHEKLDAELRALAEAQAKRSTGSIAAAEAKKAKKRRTALAQVLDHAERVARGEELGADAGEKVLELVGAEKWAELVALATKRARLAPVAGEVDARTKAHREARVARTEFQKRREAVDAKLDEEHAELTRCEDRASGQLSAARDAFAELRHVEDELAAFLDEGKA